MLCVCIEHVEGDVHRSSFSLMNSRPVREILAIGFKRAECATAGIGEAGHSDRMRKAPREHARKWLDIAIEYVE